MQDRGLHGVRLTVSDDHADLRAIFDAPDRAEADRQLGLAVRKYDKAALLRLVGAVLMEINEQWETDKIYLRMENRGPITREE